MKQAWLKSVTWAVIVETNRQLCLPKQALHKPTSDGYEPTRQLWESRHQLEMTLAEATELCRRCHRLAPFCNFNGNTFVAVIRRVIAGLQLPRDQEAAFGAWQATSWTELPTPEEQAAFAELLDRMATNPGIKPNTPS